MTSSAPLTRVLMTAFGYIRHQPGTQTEYQWELWYTQITLSRTRLTMYVLASQIERLHQRINALHNAEYDHSHYLPGVR